ncbi:MAG: hypothetical protein ABL857_07075 [Rickettsiales bacterium]
MASRIEQSAAEANDKPTSLSAGGKAHNQAITSVNEEVAIRLKHDDGILNLAKLASRGKNPIVLPKTDDEFRIIAKDLIENRQFTGKNAKGEDVVVKIEDMDKTLAEIAIKEPELHANTIKKLGAKTFDELIPTSERRAKIAEGIGKAVDDNTGNLPFLGGASFMNAIMGLIAWFTGGEGSLSDNIARTTTDNIAKDTRKNLADIGENQKNIEQISNIVEQKARKEAKLSYLDIPAEQTLAGTKTKAQIDAAKGAVQGDTVVEPIKEAPSVAEKPVLGAAAATLITNNKTSNSENQERNDMPQANERNNSSKQHVDNLKNVIGSMAKQIMSEDGTPTDPKKLADTTQVLTEATRELVKKDPKLLSDTNAFAEKIADKLLEPKKGEEKLNTAEGRVAKEIRIAAARANNGEERSDSVIKNGIFGFGDHLTSKVERAITGRTGEIQQAINTDAAKASTLSANENGLDKKSMNVALNESPMDVAMKAARQEREVLGGLGVNNRDATMLAMTSKPREANTALG